MKRILIASLFSLAAAPVFATAPAPSFNDFPEQVSVEADRTATIAQLPQPSFNDQADLRQTKGNEGVAGRAASDIGRNEVKFWTPY